MSDDTPTPDELAGRLRRELDAASADRDRWTARLAGLVTPGTGEPGTSTVNPETAPATGDIGVPHLDPEVLPGTGDPGTDPATAVLADRSVADGDRVELVNRIGGTSPAPGWVEALLAVAADAGDASDVRLAALRALAAHAFAVPMAQEYGTAYTDTLRTLLGDPVPGIRDAAAGALAGAHDDVAQQVLLAGLRGEREPAVPRHRAIELLALDDHLDNLPWLQELYGSADESDRITAVRHMGSYPEAQDRLETVVRDRAETAQVRTQAAAALRFLAPEQYDAVAKEIAVDPDDDPEVRTACLHTLTHLGDPAAVYGDPAWVGQVAELASGDAAPTLARVAGDLLDRRPAP